MARTVINAELILYEGTYMYKQVSLICVDELEKYFDLEDCPEKIQIVLTTKEVPNSYYISITTVPYISNTCYISITHTDGKEVHHYVYKQAASLLRQFGGAGWLSIVA